MDDATGGNSTTAQTSSNHQDAPLCMPCNSEHSPEDSDDISVLSATNDTTNTSLIPLLGWLHYEGHKSSSRQDGFQLRAGIIRKLTVAFAIGKLLQHMKASVVGYSQDELLRLCCVDNFAVQIAAGGTCDQGWDVIGIDMISPPMSLQLTETFESTTFFSLDKGDKLGKAVDTVVTRHSPFCCAKQAAEDQEETNENPLCYAFGVLLHFIFSGDKESISPVNLKETNHHMSDLLRSLSISPAVDVGYHCYSCHGSEEVDGEMIPRPAKSTAMPSKYREDKSPCSLVSGPIVRLVEDLLSCESGGDLYRSSTAYLSLDSASDDLHSLLLDPNRLLFESNDQLHPSTSILGRSSEARNLLDAFCRVAVSRHSEAFVIGGFSG
jgi:hypothetical protein